MFSSSAGNSSFNTGQTDESSSLEEFFETESQVSVVPQQPLTPNSIPLKNGGLVANTSTSPLASALSTTTSTGGSDAHSYSAPYSLFSVVETPSPALTGFKNLFKKPTKQEEDDRLRMEEEKKQARRFMIYLLTHN